MKYGRFYGRFFAKWALIGALAWTGYQVVGNGIQYSEGTRIGVINKISQKGFPWKVYEGEMVLEGMLNRGESFGANTWDFSFDNFEKRGEDVSDLVFDVIRYMESGQKVKVSYKQQMATWPWRSSNTYLVQKIEPVDRSGK